MLSSRSSTRRVIALVAIGLAFDAMTKEAMALLLPNIRSDLGLTYSAAGALAAVRTLTYAVCQFPAGFLADRIGARRVFAAGVLGSTLATLHFATVTTFEGALVNQAVGGVLRSCIFAPGLVLMLAAFPSNRRATAMGLYATGGVLGGVIPGFVGPPMTEAWGWRAPFWLFGILGVAIFVAAWKWIPSNVGGLAPGVVFRDALQIARRGIVLVGSFLHVVRLVAVEGLAFWLPSLLAERQMSLTAVGALVGLRMGLSGTSTIVGGYLADRLKSPIAIIGVTFGMVALTTTVIANTQSDVLLVAAIALNGIFIQAHMAPLFAVPLEVLGPGLAGSVAGLANTIGQLGGLIGLYLVGVLRDSRGDFVTAFWWIGGLCLIGVLLTGWMSRLRTAALLPGSANT